MARTGFPGCGQLRVSSSVSGDARRLRGNAAELGRVEARLAFVRHDPASRGRLEQGARRLAVASLIGAGREPRAEEPLQRLEAEDHGGRLHRLRVAAEALGDGDGRGFEAMRIQGEALESVPGVNQVLGRDPDGVDPGKERAQSRLPIRPDLAPAAILAFLRPQDPAESMMKTLTKLELVDRPAAKAAFLGFRVTPAFVGTDCADLV